MALDIKLPELGDGIESGDILQVLVRVGDRVEKGQGVIELETDKATVEVPSDHAGNVTAVHVQVGQNVPVGATLVTLEVETAGKTPAQVSPPPQATPRDVPPVPEAPKALAVPEVRKVPQVPPVPAPTLVAPVAADDDDASPDDDADSAGAASALSDSQPAATADNSAIAAGPAIRRLAREVGVDLARVTGSGPGGRIVRDDVLKVVRSASKAALNPQGDPALHDSWGPIHLERMTKIRKTIAAKMHESWTSVPRVTNFDDADITELEKFRQASKADYAAKGIKLTTMPFVIKAVAMSLKQHPLLNASLDLDREQIIFKDYVNIGIAIDSDRGLVVPSLRGVEKLSIPEIARQLIAITEKVRDNSFTLDDLRGSSFTISNLGAIGGTYSTPIINVPEVAILLVGRARQMPVVLDGEIVARLQMPLSLSYDHRLVDGATAARFLNDVISLLTSPSRLLLAP